MTAVSSAIPTVATQQPETTGKKDLNKDDFMNLFITQLQYQDPMKPMDSYQMASQLAEFSNMDATMKMSDNMEKLLQFQSSQNNIQLLSLIGKNVQAFGNSLAVNDGSPTATNFTVDGAAETCVVDIYDAANSLVRTIDMGRISSGEYELAWDGKNTQGDTVPDGVYNYKVEALDVTGQEVNVDTRSTGQVTGVDFDSGNATLSVDNYFDMNVSDIISAK